MFSCVISRYGKIYRGNRLKNCEDSGAIGVIMFSDPQDYFNPGGVNSSQVPPCCPQTPTGLPTHGLSP